MDRRQAPLNAPDDGVTRDLMLKVADDVVATILRTLALAPPPRLSVAASAAAAALGLVAAQLDQLAGCYDASSGPGHDNILLAGLIAARLGIDPTTGIADAYRDYATLKAAGLTPEEEPSDG